MLALRATPAAYPRPRLLDRVREAIRARHCSRRTGKAYVGWIKRYIFFHGKRHPAEMGAPEVSRFLPSLAVAASTQNQALNALLFLYRVVLDVDLPWLDEVVRARRPDYVPTVLSRGEVRRVLAHLEGTPRLIVRSPRTCSRTGMTSARSRSCNRGPSAVRSPADRLLEP
jgi:integrase